ncbi:hypothetical protein ACJJTC_018542 [Scirpophaga incertulas]
MLLASTNRLSSPLCSPKNRHRSEREHGARTVARSRSANVSTVWSGCRSTERKVREPKWIPGLGTYESREARHRAAPAPPPRAFASFPAVFIPLPARLRTCTPRDRT